MMKRESERQRTLRLVHQRTRQTFAEIQTLLAPELPGQVPPEALASHLQARLERLPPEQREPLLLRIAAAQVELQGQIKRLSMEMATLNSELRRVSSHAVATAAYGRAGRGTPRGRQ
jgi:hypothetical protein